MQAAARAVAGVVACLLALSGAAVVIVDPPRIPQTPPVVAAPVRSPVEHVALDPAEGAELRSYAAQLAWDGARRARTRRADRSAPTGAQGGVCGDDCLAAIARCENRSGDPALDHPGDSTASGLYGVLDGTWDGYGGYARAKDAPAETQHAWAREAAAKSGSKPWRASRGCHGY